LTVLLDAVPLSGKLNIRKDEPREERQPTGGVM
jgi:hypothetical protein